MRCKRAMIAGTLVVAMAAAAGCGSDDSGSSSSSSGSSGTTSSAGAAKKTDVAYITYAYTDFVQAEVKGVKQAVAKTGGSVKVFNSNFDPTKQTQQCQDAITSRRYNAIVLAGVTNVAGIPCATQAAAAKIPVVAIENPVGKTFDIQPQTKGVVAQVTGSFASNHDGYLKMIADACKGIDPCKVIAETAAPSDPLTNDALKTVKAQAGSNVQVVATFSSGYDPAAVAKAMPDLLRAHKDANVFMSAADSSALAAIPALKSAGLEGKVKLIGNGGSRLGAKAIADGTMFATLGNWPEQNGVKAGGFAVQAVSGQEIATPGVDAFKIDTPFEIYKDNVSQFTPEWGATA